MISIDVRADIRAATEFLTDLQSKQIPFACWAAWLAGLAEEIRRFASMVRAAEERMRAMEEQQGAAAI